MLPTKPTPLPASPLPASPLPASWLKRLIPRGLMGRSLLILVIPILLLQAVTAYIFFTRHWDTVLRRLADGISGDVLIALDLLHRYPAPMDQDWIIDEVSSKLNLKITYQYGGVLPKDEPTSTNSIEYVLADQIDNTLTTPFLVRADTTFGNTLVIRVQQPEGVVTFVAPRKRLYSATNYILILWMIGTSVVLIGVATIFINHQVRSIRRLASSADGFGKGRDLPPIHPEGAAEVRQAGMAFNLMRQRVERQMVQRTEMLAGVSHDLRTPLTRMKLQLAMMDESGDTRDLADDITEMERMIEGYLAFARGEGTEAVGAVDLGFLVDDVVARFRRQGHPLQVRGSLSKGAGDDPLVLPLRRHGLERGLSNLLSNAARYGQHVILTLGLGELYVTLSVEDDGPGIPPDQHEEVFRPFVRGAQSHTLASGGTGLGLTIARDVARAHGGDITLDTSPELGGLRATLRLPL